MNRISRLLSVGGPIELVKGISRFIYWQGGIRSGWYALRFRFSDNIVTSTIAGSTVNFRAESAKEFARASTLHGERAVIADFLRTINPGDTVYDVGANIGTYACFAANKIDEGAVVAFEPHPTNVRRLRENISLNGAAVTVCPVALSNESATAELSIAGNTDIAGVGTHSLSSDGKGETIETEMVEGDRLISEGHIPSPSILKIDVEGAEMLVLDGLSSTLENSDCRTIFCEVHPDKLPGFGGTEQNLQDFLKSKGFSLQIIGHRSPEYFLKASRIEQ